MIRNATLILLALIGFAHASFAQFCSPQAVSAPGIYPDSATNFAPAYQNSYYEQIITVVVPADTSLVAGGPALPITNIALVSLTGLPDGLSYGCLPTNCVFPGNTTNCAKIYGTPIAAPGTYPISVTVLPTVAGSPFINITFDYYKIVVNPPLGLTSKGINSFEIQSIDPNPSQELSRLNFTLPTASRVNMRVSNAIGKQVLIREMNLQPGLNTVDLETAHLPSGLYFVTIEANGKVLTRRLAVE